MSKCVIESVSNLDDSDSTAVVLEYENATPMDADSVVDITKDRKTKTKEMTVECKGNRDTTYKGVIGDGYPTDLMRTYLAIRNKRTKKVRFVEVEQCRLKSIHHLERHIEPETKAIDVKSLLYKNYGSKAAARSIDRKEKTAYNSDIVKNVMNESISASFNEAEAVTETPEELDICPPWNKDATKVSEAYKLDDIIPKEILRALHDPALSLIEMKAMHLPFTTPFLINMIKTIQISESPDSKFNVNRLKICIYLNCLINLVNTPTKFITNNEIPEIAKPIADHIKETFSEQSSSKAIKSKQSRQKVLCYYIVLALLTTHDYTLGLENLIEGVKVTKTEATKLARYVGAIFQVKTEKIVLKLKSQLPKMNSSYRKRKRDSL